MKREDINPEPRTRMINVRLAESTFARLRALARQADESVSVLLRREIAHLLDHWDRARKDKADWDRVHETRGQEK